MPGKSSHGSKKDRDREKDKDSKQKLLSERGSGSNHMPASHHSSFSSNNNHAHASNHSQNNSKNLQNHDIMCFNSRITRISNLPIIILSLVLVFMTLIEILPHSVTTPRYISSTLAELSNGLIENSNRINDFGSDGKVGQKMTNETLKAALESLIVYAAEYNQEDQVADLIAAMMKEVNTGSNKASSEELKSEIEKDAVRQILEDEQRQNLEEENQKRLDERLSSPSSTKLSDLDAIQAQASTSQLDSLRRQKLEEEDETEDDNSMIGLPNFERKIDSSLPDSSAIRSKVDGLLSNAISFDQSSIPAPMSANYDTKAGSDYRNMRRQEVKDRLAAGSITVNDNSRPASAYSYNSDSGPVAMSSLTSSSSNGETRYKSDPSQYDVKFHSDTTNNIPVGNHNDPYHTHELKEQFQKQPTSSGGGSDDDGTVDPSTFSSEQSKLFLSKVSKVLEKKHELVHNERILMAQRETDDYYYPKMIMVGVKKCGTGALARFLNMHPIVKYAGEQYYFNRYYTNSLDWYLHQMPRSRPSEIVFEKTPSYLFSPSVAENIKKFDPNIKIINIMCDPARRIYSDFLHMNRFSPETAGMDNFEDALLEGLSNIKSQQDQVDQGYTTWDELWHKLDFKFATRGSQSFGKAILRSCYSIYLKKWYQLFGQNQNMLNIDGSRLYTDPGQVLVEIQQFLNVPIALDENNFYFDENRGLFCSIDFNGKPKCAGKGKGRSVKSEVPEHLKQKMRDLLRPFNEELERIEGKSFNDWNW